MNPIILILMAVRRLMMNKMTRLMMNKMTHAAAETDDE